MTHHAKAPSAGSTQAGGNSRGLFRRALATRGAFGDSKGTGAPSPRRARATLAVLALAIAAFAITAAPASADPLAAEMGTISNVSYASAHVTGKVTSPGGFFATSYAFEYSKDPEAEGWHPGPGGEIFGAVTKDVFGDFENLKGGTEYFVRLTANSFLTPAASPEAPPYPDFTTFTADPPTIPGAVSASPILSTSATANAEVNRPVASDDVTCRFEYVSDEDFGTTGFAGASARNCDQNPIGAADAATDKKVTAALGCTNPLTEEPEGKCLKPGTAYRLRAVAKSAGGEVTKDAVTTFTTAPPVAKPAVTAANDATEVSYFTAKVSGVVQRPAGADPALNTACRFEYVTDEDFGTTGFAGAASAPCVEAPPEAPLTATDPTPVSAELSGLKGAPTGTTYHLRLNAYNAGGSDFKEASSFTTLPSKEPTFEVHPISPADVGYTTAQATATVDSGQPDHHMIFQFQLSTNPAEGWAAGENGFRQTSQPGINDYPSDVFQGLKPGTKYYVRTSGVDYFFPGDYFGGTQIDSPEPYESFTTKGTAPLPPLATLDPITIFTGTSAHFSGTVDANAPDEALPPEVQAYYKTDWHIECVPECKDANGNEIAGTIEGDAGEQPIAGVVKRLEPNKDYEVKLIAHNILGTVESVQTFHTLKIPPTVKQTTGASDGKGGYNLQGVVNPNNQTVTGCEFKWGPDAPAYAFSAPCSPPPGGGSKPITVEAHLTGLNTGVNYHALLIVKYGADSEAKGVDQEFKATLDSPESCPENEQIRNENSSLALPECRAYEKVSPEGKEGFPADLIAFYGGERVIYNSGAGNISNSGAHQVAFNYYVTDRTTVGWATIPNHRTSEPFSEDLLSSIVRPTSPIAGQKWALRNPDGTVTVIGPGASGGAPGTFDTGAVSADLSHLVRWPSKSDTTTWGPGVYEYVGTGNDQPRRVDLDNSGNPITTCSVGLAQGVGSAFGQFLSRDGRVIVFSVAGFCGGDNPPALELWARIDGTTSIDVSASQCNRTAPACNAPVGDGACGNGTEQATGREVGSGCRDLRFQGAAKDGSRIFFSTKRQLLNGDTDESNDLYACDIPAVTPAPVGKASPCAALRRVSAGAPTGADFESVSTVSDNGATALFAAKGVLAANEDALKEKAVAGDHNLYAWRTDAAHPDGQTTFVARLDSIDLNGDELVGVSQATPDGRYLVFTTASQLLDTDTDNARDLYRYDVDAGQLTRVSTNVFGVAGNGEGFDVSTGTPTVSDDGQKVVFTTAEALNAAVDGNGEPDVYLWTPSRISLISAGAVGAAATREGLARNPAQAVISGSGRDIYFETPGALTPADGDDLGDVYDARIDGGFSFASEPICTGEKCQPAPTPAPPKKVPLSAQPGSGNPTPPKPCPKGKVHKGKKCVKKNKKHHGKKHHGKQHKRASSNGGGGK